MPKEVSTGKVRSKIAAAIARDQSAPLRSAVSKVSNEPKNALTNDTFDSMKSSRQNIEQLPLSRGQRKRQAKRDQFFKRERLILSTLRIKHDDDQKKRIDGLDALKEALQDAMQSSNVNEDLIKEEKAPVKAITCKSKQSIAQKEITHMNLVLQHPAFVSNPFATMQEHLRNTFARQAKEQQVKAEEELRSAKAEAIKKKEVRKERIRDAKFDAAKRAHVNRKKRDCISR